MEAKDNLISSVGLKLLKDTFFKLDSVLSQIKNNESLIKYLL